MVKKYFYPAIALAALTLIFFGCIKKEQGLEPALESIRAEELLEDVKILSSDEFEGRAPASKGEEKTIQFLKQEFQKLGLKPGNSESFFQEVPMVEITADPATELEIKGKKTTDRFDFGDEFVANTLRVVKEVSIINSELVFVGYGIIAPEYDWNDYEGLDVRGKTVVILQIRRSCSAGSRGGIDHSRDRACGVSLGSRQKWLDRAAV